MLLFLHLWFESNWVLLLAQARIEIFDISADISVIYRISADISAIYRISVYSEVIFVTENRLKEKSKKIGKCRRYFADISVSDRNFGE